ncbi:MAG: hypothetical protein WC215_00550 [Bacilli bacterium]|nr:hypothetical protein [Bacilli bacterium]
MAKLLKLQLFRALKDKGTIVFMIITLVLGVFSMLFNFLLANSLGQGNIGLLGNLFDTNVLINSSFSLSSTPMVLLIIMGVVLLYKESGWGTIRNQVVAGYSKIQVYFANFLAMLIVLFTILFTYQLMTLGLGYVFGFELGIANAAEFWAFLRSYSLNLLIFITEVAFMTFISLMFQNIIAPVFLVVIVPIFVGAILQTVVPIVVIMNEARAPEIIAAFEYVIWYQNTALTISGFNHELTSGVGGLLGATLYDTGSLAFILKTIGTSIALNGIFLGLGSYMFSRKDLK